MAHIPQAFPYSPALIPQRDSAASDGIWRWNPLLPLNGDGVYPLQIGGTPLVSPPGLRAALSLSALWLKDETRTPTGSNKDRATALCLVDAVQRGATSVACASSGNVACSLAAGAAAMGLQAFIFVSSRTVSPSKVAFMRSFGATVFLVDAPYETAYRLCDAACEQFGWYNRNTASNPLAMQAKKTVAFEVWEQLGRTMPNVVYLPVGDGVTLAAFVHGCQELIECGVADRLPRVVGVQVTGASPLVRAVEAGREVWAPMQTSTFADGIDVGDPYFGQEALAAVKQTGGSWLAVSDDDLRGAIATLARTSGMLAEPAGAAALAGVIAHREQLAASGESVVALVSGTGLKDQRWLPSDGGRALPIPPTLDAVSAALGPG